MDEPAMPGQGRAASIRMLARAARALAEDGSIGTETLLQSYRAASPAGHADSAADVVDAAFVAHAYGAGGDALLSARCLRLVPAPWRASWRFVPANGGTVELHAPPREDLAGDALLLMLGLALESAKLAHGLPAPGVALRGAFATPGAAQSALAALRSGGAARVLEMTALTDRVDRAALAALVGDRPCFVVAGDGGAHAHDLLSPYARRLRAPLHELATRSGQATSRDEAVYVGLAALLATSPAVSAERVAAERADGCEPVGDGAIAIRCEALPDGEVDRRCREAAAQLKRARALLVLVEPCRPALDAVLATLGRSARAVAVISRGTSSTAPTALVDSATTHVALIDNALAEPEGHATGSTLHSLPSLRLAGDHPDQDAGTFALVQSVLAARACGLLDPRARIAVRTAASDEPTSLSSACVELVARLAPKPPPRARTR